MPREQRAELDVDQLVAVHREHVARLPAEAGGEADAAAAAEPLGLARAHEPDTEGAEPVEECLLLPREAAHDHAVDPGPREPADLPGEERPASDRHERLRQAPRGVAEPLGLATGEDDRLHQRGPFAAARPIAS
ncbi:MAG: hypothetical protein M5U27_00735 [Gaiella sp.]|nr:hypothetical protein [Gaiella sp.]